MRKTLLAFLLFGALLEAGLITRRVLGSEPDRNLPTGFLPLSVAYERTLDQMWGVTLTGDGTIKLFGSETPTIEKRLAAADFTRVRRFFGSEEFIRLVTRLRLRHYRPGESDLPEVELDLKDERLGYGVCSNGEVINGVDQLADEIDYLVRTYFSGELDHRLPRLACRADQAPSGEAPW